VKQLPPQLATPENIELVALHEKWLQSPVAAKVRQLLDHWVTNYTNFAATGSVTSEISAESVRIRAAQLHTLLKLRDTLYDTERFITEIARPHTS